MKTVLLSFFALIVLASCSKSEDDFVGEYKFYTVSYVNVEDTYKPGLLSLLNEAMEFYAFDPVEVSVFTENGKLKGEVRVVRTMEGVGSKVARDKVSFDLKNFRVQNDTLLFSISNAFYQRSYKGFLIEENGRFNIGVEKDFAGATGLNKNAYFRSLLDDYVVYNTNLSSEGDIVKSFYTTQRDSLKSLYEKEKDDDKKYVLSNSFKFLDNVYLKK